MPTEVRVARTAYDRQHVNRIRQAVFGVLNLHLEAGKVASKSYVAHKAPDGAGSDGFHFAPEKEKIKIKYRIDDAAACITKARLELYFKNQNSAAWKQDLKDDQFADGDNEIEWDGKVTDKSLFPDEYVTVEHSPYKLRITVEGTGYCYADTAWTYFHILVKEIDLELGDKRAIPKTGATAAALARRKLDQHAYDSLGGKLPGPKDAKATKVMLLSNLFQTKYAQLMDHTAYLRYETEWDNGPNLPIFAKVWISSSGDAKVDAPKALGKVKFLWDWEDVAESGFPTQATDFLTKTLDYDKNVAEPKPGDNCHKDRGGKRGDNTKPIFPPQGGDAPKAAAADGTFPFKVEACGTRTWAAFSYAWGTGEFAGKTGVLFRPARMAADAYRLTVYLAYDPAMVDVKDAPPLKSPISRSTGVFQIWRELALARICKKDSSLPTFPVATFQKYYAEAYLQVEDNSGAAFVPGEADWNSKVTTAVSSLAAAGQAAVDSAINQFTIGKYAVHFRSHADFLTTYEAALGLTTPAAIAAWLAAGGSAYVPAATYHMKCKEWAQSIIKSACDGYISPNEGITIVQFDGLHNHVATTAGSGLNGYAENFPSATGADSTVATHRCGFVQCAAATAYVVTATNKNTLEQTVTHEIGHHLFLSHSKDSVSATDPYYDTVNHDVGWTHCMMSYAWTVERKFCGFCLLKLRGWDQRKLLNVAASNKK